MEDLVVWIERLRPSAKVPSKAHPDDACWDLFAAENCLVKPFGRRGVKTGIALAIPDGWGGFIEPRSGLAFHRGILILGGVIDSGYRGEVQVILLNLGEETLVVKEGDRIAQIAFRQIPSVRFIEVESLPRDSARGSDGFGSTERGAPSKTVV